MVLAFVSLFINRLDLVGCFYWNFWKIRVRVLLGSCH